MLTRQEWLISNRFILDPFQSGAFFAETDSLLDLSNMPSYIDKSDIKKLIGNLDEPGPCYIFAKPGCGKSSLRKRIHHEYETLDLVSSEPKFLLIDYVDHNYSDIEIEFEHHVSRIINLAETSLAFNLTDVKMAVQISPKIALNKLSKICKDFGYSGVYILIDNISDLQILSKIKSIMQSFDSDFEGKRFFVVKYFLNDSLFLPVQSTLLKGEFSPYLLIWNEDELHQILKQRLLACLDEYISRNIINPLAHFCDTRIVNLLQSHFTQLGLLANSPRIMWLFGYYLFEEYINSFNVSQLSLQNLVDDDILRKTPYRFLNHFSLSESIFSFRNILQIDGKPQLMPTLQPQFEAIEEVDNKVFNLLKKRTDNHLQTKIYLCYADKDIKRVKPIYLRLLESGYTPWMHYFNILAGLDWREQRTLAVRESQNFLVFLSENSYTEEGYFRKEIIDAMELWQTKLREIPYLIPIRLEECQIPIDLSKLLHVDIFDDLGWNRLILSLEESRKMREAYDIKPRV